MGEKQQLPPFLKQVNNSILYNGDGEFAFYIPEKYFDLKVTFYTGEFISTLGIMTYSYMVGNKRIGPLQFNYPTRFLTKPYKVDKLKEVKLVKQTKKQDYRILKYRKGDTIIQDIDVPEEIENVEALLKMFIISGHIPNTIPYDQLQNYFIDNIRYNGYNYGVSLQLIGIALSEICRSSKDIQVPFRLSKTKDMNDYQSISVKSVAKLISSYSALTSENFNEAVVFASLNDNKIGSPLERVLTGENIS